MKHMNQEKHTCPEGKERYRAPANSGSKKADTIKVKMFCKCGDSAMVTVARNTNKYFAQKYQCVECKRQENLFGNNKNFLTALEGL